MVGRIVLAVTQVWTWANPMKMLQVSTDIVACLTAFNVPSWGLVPDCLKLKPVCRDTESPSREGPEQSCATPRCAVLYPAGAHQKYTSGIISLQITEGGEMNSYLLAASFLSLPLHKGDVLCEDGVDDSPFSHRSCMKAQPGEVWGLSTLGLLERVRKKMCPCSGY